MLGAEAAAVLCLMLGAEAAAVLCLIFTLILINQDVIL